MKFYVLVFSVLLILLMGCPPPDDESGTGKITIVGFIKYDSTFGEDITIDVLENGTVYSENMYGGDSISTATVTINDIELPYDDTWGYIDDGTLITLIAGSEYTIKVVCDGNTYEETITMPPEPNITSHSDGDAWDETAATDLVWSPATTTHDENQVLIPWYNTQSEDEYNVILPAATTTHTIPAGTLEADVGYFPGARLYVKTRTKITDLGSDFDSDSFILFMNEESIAVDTSL
ncbi:MAG: hypothetical protein JXJ04_13175 [Spirochaetales bacterium]|nr:hypothetical protein [Spirochaetales bacterium]